jgi:hypothetical protein
VAQNNAAAVRVHDNVGGFDIVVEDPFSINADDGIADIGPDAKMPAIRYDGYQIVIGKLTNTESRDVLESDGSLKRIKFEELNDTALKTNQS